MEHVRVLHVDDEPEFADLTSDLLVRQDERLDVTTVDSATAGLATLEDGAFDCIVSDYQMPGMDGLSFFEAVRERDADIPFILFTGKGSEEIAAEAVSAGVTDYLQKESGTEQFAILANRIANAAERYRATREVTATRARFRTLLSDAADYIHVIDADGTVTYTTPSVEHVLGYEPATLEGRDVLEQVHPEDRDLAVERFETVAADAGREVTVEVRVRHRDGSWRWLSVKMRNLLDDPTIEGIVANVRDVTERRERAAAVDWHKQIIEHMREGVYVVDEAHELRFVDYRVPGVDMAEADWEGRQLSSLAEAGIVDAAELADIESAIDTLFAGEEREVRLELEPEIPQSAAVIELRLTPLSTDAGSFVLGTTRDVTATKRRERELRATKELYQTLIETFPNGGVFAFDADLKYTLAGGKGIDAVGLTPAAMEGKTPFDLFPEPIAEETARYYRKALDGESNTFHQQFQGNHYRVRTVPLHGEDGTVTGGMAVSQDVTAQYERERELERQTERLDAFASVVAHDLRNPLTVLRTSLDLAAETGESVHFERCHRNVDRMEALIDDVLTLARQGERIDTLEPVGLSSIAADCWAAVDSTDATLAVETDATVQADPGRLRQLLENLFANSVDHGGEDVTITLGTIDALHTDTRKAAGSTGGFYVADDGPGIPPDERDRVLESGYSTSRDGTGFGLAIVAEIVDAHGWTIDVTESADGGARFEITDVDHEP